MSRDAGRRRRPTIAFFGAPLGATLHYQKWQMWSGVSAVCCERGAHALYIAGDQADTSPSSVLYDLIGAQAVDGIISWTGVVTSWPNTQQVRDFLGRYRPLPVLNAGWHVPGIPSLAFDQGQGMRGIIDHLIERHHRRRIAYAVRQPQRFGQEASYHGYEEGLRQRGLFDPLLLVEADPAGPLATLDARDLRPGADYDAVVASTDGEAIQVINELRKRGISVPADVAVTGLHDGQEARIADPPLTTARMPWRRMGRRAAEVLLDMIAGCSLPECELIPLQLVVRRSCGCQDPEVVAAAVESMAQTDGSPPDILARERETILEVAGSLGFPAGGAEVALVQALLAGLQDELIGRAASEGWPGEGGPFLRALEQGLERTAASGGEVAAWQGAISTLRRRLQPRLAEPDRAQAENLWQQARVLIGQAATRRETRQSWQLMQEGQALQGLEATLHAAYDLPPLLAGLADRLPQLGISRCYLSLYEDRARPAAGARLVLAYDEQGSRTLPAEGTPFPTCEIVPGEYLPADERLSLAVAPLHFGEEQFGLVAFEADPGQGAGLGTLQEAVRSQLSSALYGLRARQEIERARREAEEANSLKSRFLSVVSHELRTPLSLIVGLCQMAFWEQSHPDRGQPETGRATGAYLEQIHTSAQHLERLIRDVLDLASSQVGQLKLTCERIDPGELLHEAAAMGRQMAEGKRLSWQADIPVELPPVWGDRTRLRQVVLNLLSNAVKFTARGKVTLRARAEGGQVTVSVSDTGLGIAAQEQGSIFSEFQQSERTATRGYGGMGLGLAISRRLVELHGGRIGVRSEGQEGLGSTFYFSLPAMEPEPGPVSTATPIEGKVFVLTGAATAGGRLSRYLQERGFAVDEASIADEGWLAAVLAARPAAVVLDLPLGAEPSWQFVRTLREHPATGGLPVLFCSLAEAQDRGAILDLACLAKPLPADCLAQVLARHGLGATGEADTHRTGTVLVVDDEPGILELHASLVRRQLPGWRVLTARDGREALCLIREELPDLVLLDLLMPEMDGFAVLEAIRDGETTRGIPVVVVTGQTLAADDMARLNRGVVAVLGKGLFTVEETLAQVEAALSRDKRLGGEAQRLARQAMAYIHTHYTEEVGRKNVARHLGVNESYLSHCFAAEAGVPLLVYLNRYRIRQARLLLETTGRSVTDVALEVGFSSPSYFSRVFRREVGVSPLAYQRGKRGRGEGISPPQSGGGSHVAGGR